VLRSLLRNAKLRARVLERAEEFKLNNLGGEDLWFRELVFCILTANSSFVSAYYSLQSLGDNIYVGTREEIAKALKESGYRFYNLKSTYIIKNRELIYGKLKRTVKEIADVDQLRAREFLINLHGIGMKEASHFLRNVGYFDLAIIDRHILNFIQNYLVISNKHLTKTKYIYLESVLRGISANLDIQLGLLDLFIWFKETKTLVK
jgi:N-glycosylase/DNA lyase